MKYSDVFRCYVLREGVLYPNMIEGEIYNSKKCDGRWDSEGEPRPGSGISSKGLRPLDEGFDIYYLEGNFKYMYRCPYKMSDTIGEENLKTLYPAL